MAFMKRVRLDDELISQGICADRADALRTLMAGLVSSGGERLTSPGLKVTPGLPLHVKGRIPYVGRGGLKLEGALDAFGIDPSGLACLDVGCSTGGFTDCLLKRGAATVVSVDVCVSPIHGAKGNVEFFLYGTRFAPGERSQDELQSQVSVLSEKAATL